MLTLTLRICYQFLLETISPLNKSVCKHVVKFRCWPIDVDTNLHMNNAQFFRVAELTRWRIGAGSNMQSLLYKHKWMFLAVEQSAIYLRAIQPFERYCVSTTITPLGGDKYIEYVHTFEQHPDLVKDSNKPIKYAVVTAKAVVKERSGKTVRPSELAKYCDIFKVKIGKDVDEE
eukprot:gene2562-5003_t